MCYLFFCTILIGSPTQIDVCVVLGPFANDEPALRRSVFSNTISFLEKVFSSASNKMSISNVNGVNVGVIINGASPRVIFKLGELSTLKRLKDALRSLSLPSATTDQATDFKRLGYLVKYQFSQNGGASSGREGVPKVFFFITSGNDIDDLNDSADVIRNLKAEGVKVVTVTVGNDLDSEKYGNDLADSEKSLFVVKNEKDQDLLLNIHEGVQKELLGPSKFIVLFFLHEKNGIYSITIFVRLIIF